jgi:hypothetical protein
MTTNQASDAKDPVAETRNNSILKQQLVREITCLERQLERIRSRSDFADDITLMTYAEMIGSRRKMLHNLPWED